MKPLINRIVVLIYLCISLLACHVDNKTIDNVSNPVQKSEEKVGDSKVEIKTLTEEEGSFYNYQSVEVLLGEELGGHLGHYTNKLTSWDHTSNYPEEFEGLLLPSEHYALRSVDLTETENISQKSVITLIKKYGDWHHQHANGLTAQFTALPFSDVLGIKLILRVNRALSHLPNNDEIAKTYRHIISKDNLTTLDDGNVYLSISLRGAEPKNITDPRFNAHYLLTLNAKTQLNNWYSIFIPVNNLIRYNEVNYQKTPVSEKHAKLMPISDFILTAETASTKVIRNFIPTTFDHNVPKLFKEVALEIKYIGVVKTNKGR